MSSRAWQHDADRPDVDPNRAGDRLSPGRVLVGVITMKVDVQRCARCGEDHQAMEFNRFDTPLDEEWTHWALCPVRHEPVVLKIVDTEDSAEPLVE